MDRLKSFWTWFTTKKRSSGTFLFALLGAACVGIGLNMNGGWVSIVALVGGALVVSASLDMAANEARAAEATKWAHFVLSMIADDRNVEITVRNVSEEGK